MLQQFVNLECHIARLDCCANGKVVEFSYRFMLINSAAANEVSSPMDICNKYGYVIYPTFHRLNCTPSHAMQVHPRAPCQLNKQSQERRSRPEQLLLFSVFRTYATSRTTKRLNHRSRRRRRYRDDV
jgi:hypothetical protein